MTSQSVEPSDHHQYSWVMLYTDTVRFLLSALRFYEAHLRAEAESLDADPHLKSFISEETRREFRMGRGLTHITLVKDWLQEKLEKAGDSYDLTLTIDHGTARLLKSVGLLYLELLRNKRNVLASDPSISQNTIGALDRELAVKEELLTQAGIFANATTVPLLAIQQVPMGLREDPGNSFIAPLLPARRPSVVVIDSIEILDEELRVRCLDLFRQFQESGQSERHDTVVAEATRILEHRMRALTHADAALTGTDLATKVFSGDRPLLTVSSIHSEQKAVHLLFLGTFGFIRNPVHHKLLSNLTANRVVQILGLVDYLISILNSAKREEI